MTALVHNQGLRDKIATQILAEYYDYHDDRDGTALINAFTPHGQRGAVWVDGVQYGFMFTLQSELSRELDKYIDEDGNSTECDKAWAVMDALLTEVENHLRYNAVIFEM